MPAKDHDICIGNDGGESSDTVRRTKVFDCSVKAPKWLSLSPILSRFKGKGKDKHAMYRDKVQRYANEEQKLWENLRHGIILGTKQFVDKIRDVHLPTRPHKEIAQQCDLSKRTDPVDLLNRASRILDFDLNYCKNSLSLRISKSSKNGRNLLVFLVWKTGVLTNEEIGCIFGVTYSSIRHIIRSIKSKMEKDSTFKEKYHKINSLCKM